MLVFQPFSGSGQLNFFLDYFLNGKLQTGKTTQAYCLPSFTFKLADALLEQQLMHASLFLSFSSQSVQNHLFITSLPTPEHLE